MNRAALKEATDVEVAFNAEEPFAIDVKRFSIPGLKFTITCPHCGLVQSWEPDYFGYPEANGVETVSLCCYGDGKNAGKGCNQEYRFDVRIGVTVDLLVTDEEQAKLDAEKVDSQ